MVSPRHENQFLFPQLYTQKATRTLWYERVTFLFIDIHTTCIERRLDKNEMRLG